MSGYSLERSLIGKPVFHFLFELFRIEPCLSEIHFATYKPEPNLTERLKNDLTIEESGLRDSATEVCHENGIPYWDALLGLSMVGDSFPLRFLDVANSHSGDPPALRFVAKRGEISEQTIMRMKQELPEGNGLAVRSPVLVDNRALHVPMLDFRCPTTESNVTAILRIVNLLGQKHGVLAESGRSFHFYGTRFLTPSEWVEFMARSLLFAPITDPRYVAHRLIDGECRLKIIDTKTGLVPKISDVF